MIKKGINTLLLEYRFTKKLSQINFNFVDVLLYSTPPITFQKVVTKLKKKYNCINYLVLKDIFPQNAVDLNLVRKNSLMHKYFRKKEKNLYKYSDIIGCMSPANKKYLIDNNDIVKNKLINITPNCIAPKVNNCKIDKKTILQKYDIPFKTLHLVYGGNIGKPQGIDFIIKCIHEIKKYDEIFFTIIGNGKEFNRLKKYVDINLLNIKIIDNMPKDEYLRLLSCMDIGLAFLDNRFTIPNFPSRILDYMNYSLPVIACTDVVCDLKQEICDQGAGFWCRSDDIEGFKDILDKIIKDKNMLANMGKISRELLMKKYSAQKVVDDLLYEINNFKNRG
jgi:glycosyltransferase involved in cell wall biosynthesis